MNRVIAQRVLRNQTAAVMTAVEAGQRFVITRRGTPVAELGPVSTPVSGPHWASPRRGVAQSGEG